MGANWIRRFWRKDFGGVFVEDFWVWGGFGILGIRFGDCLGDCFYIGI